MKPLRLRAGVNWEQGLLGSALREGIPLARGASRPLKGGEWPKIKLTKNHWELRDEVRRPRSSLSLAHWNAERQILFHARLLKGAHPDRVKLTSGYQYRSLSRPSSNLVDARPARLLPALITKATIRHRRAQATCAARPPVIGLPRKVCPGIRPLRWRSRQHASVHRRRS